MKKIVAIFLLFTFLSVSIFASSYETKVFEWQKNLKEYLHLEKPPEWSYPQDVEYFLYTNANKQKSGDSLSFLFFPKRSTFDQIVVEDFSFLEMGHIKAIAKDMGYEVATLEYRRQCASFNDKEQLNNFLEKYFLSSLDQEKLKNLQPYNEDQGRLVFQTKVCVIELKKL